MKYVQKYMFFISLPFLFLLLCFKITATSNERDVYIYLNDVVYNVAQCIYAASEFDDEMNSPINELKCYIDEGGKAALCDEVVCVLDYAQKLLMHKYSVENKESYENLLFEVDSLLAAIDKGLLALSVRTIDQSNKSFLMIENIQLYDAMEQGPIVRLNEQGNITMVDSTDSLHGNIVKGGDLFINNFGTDNTFIGKFSGIKSNVTSNNTGVGFNSLVTNDQGLRNVAVGGDALNSRLVSNQSVAIGDAAMASEKRDTIGFTNSCVAIGDEALFSMKNDSSFNTAIGYRALMNRDLAFISTFNAVRNVAIGESAGKRISGNAKDTQLNSNVLIGNRSGRMSSTLNIVFENNICIGNDAGSRIGIAEQINNLTAKNNIYIGNPKVGMILSNVTAIGTTDNQKRCFIAAVRRVPTGRGDAISVVVDSDNQVTTISSSQRFKDNVQLMNEESEAIYSLNPVSFIYNNDSAENRQYGLIAEEVNEYLCDLVVKDKDDVPYTVRYEVLPVLLLNELKKHENEIRQQRGTLQEQEYLLQHNKNDIHMHAQEVKQQSKDIDNVLCFVNKLQKKVESFVAQ